MNNKAGIEFAIDSNVNIQIIDPNNVIRQDITIHNKATQNMVIGIMRFLRGEFCTSYRQTKDDKLLYKDDAKNYIPCFINIGTGGIKLVNTPSGPLPDYNTIDRRIAPTEDWWNSNTNYVHFTDTKLFNEQTFVPRYPIGLLDLQTDAIHVSYQGGDIEQIVFATDVAPNTFNTIYGGNTDIFITELGLYSTSEPGNNDLLARVILKNTEDNNYIIPYVRSQDTIIINWIISIISLNDINTVDEDSIMTINSNTNGNINRTIASGTVIEDNIPYTGTIDNEIINNEEGV